MPTIIKIAVPAVEFVFAEAFEAVPDLKVELQPIVPVTPRTVPLFFVWDCPDVAAFEREAATEPLLNELTRIDELQDGYLYRAKWAEEGSDYQDVLRKTGATVRQAIGKQGDWRFEIEFSDAEGAAAFQRAAEERGVSFELQKLRELTEMKGKGMYGLTRSQRRILVSAYEEGYFKVPRDVTLEKLATKHDVSAKAVSGRMRRGLSQLISESLVDS